MAGGTPPYSFTDMVSAIAFELGQRTDLIASVIPKAIYDAIKAYQKERFRFNELQPLAPFTFNTVPGTAYYGVDFDARIPLLYKIDYLNYLLGSTTEKMERVTPEEVYLALQNGTESGPPLTWAYDGDTIVMYPAPNTAYPITVGGYLAVAAPTDLADTTNPWMNAAERLIRSRAKFEISLHVTRNEKLASAMSTNGGASELYFNELKAEASRIRGRSRTRAMQF